MIGRQRRYWQGRRPTSNSGTCYLPQRTQRTFSENVCDSVVDDFWWAGIYSPPTVSPSILIVGQAIAPRKLQIVSDFGNVEKDVFQVSCHGDFFDRKASSPPEIQIPEAPRE